MSDAHIQHFHHAPTGTLSWVIADPSTGKAAVVDPVLGFCNVSGRSDPAPASLIADYLRDRALALEWILETHAHADHLSAAQLMKSRLGGTIGIGRGICNVQAHFAKVFNLGAGFVADGSQFDRLFEDGDTFMIGRLECRVLATPGHTSDSVTYIVGNAAFVGDTLFMPDLGSARCDFPGGDAATLYDSIRKLLALPDETLLCMCHDYPPPTRDVRVSVTVAEQKAANIHVGGARARADYVAMRELRDAGLELPGLILPALQVNVRGGRFPDAEDNGVSYLKMPVDLL